MIELEISNADIKFGINEIVESKISYVGVYEQYSTFISTQISRTYDNEIDIFTLDIHEDWSIETIPNDYILKNRVVINQEANGWIAYIKDMFYKFPQVESIYYTIDEDKIDVWIIIPKRDFSLLRKLVDLEMNVLDTFETNETNDKPLYQFEFHIIYCGRLDEANLIPQRALRILK